MRKLFELTDQQFQRLIYAGRPVPYMIIGDVHPRSPQENANDAWRALGRELGFDGMTVEPDSRGQRFFTAEVVADVRPDPTQENTKP